MALIDVTTEDYRSAVKTLAELKEKLDFPNRGVVHASIVMENLFKNFDEVAVFSKGMNGTLSKVGNYQSALQDLLERPDSKIRFLLQHQPNPSSETFLRIKHYPDKAEVRVLKQEHIDTLRNTNFVFLNRFAVGGKQAFRRETDSNKNTAICSFNNAETAQKLLDNFEYLYSDKFSDKIEL